MRIAEFAWGNMEPEEGKFDFSLFLTAMDKLHAAGIAVVLCTPTATPPKWLTDKYEETLTMLDRGDRKRFGGRAHVCKSSPVMREKNRIIVTKMCEAFKDHPSVIGWQIDNEIYPSENGCFCPLCLAKFQKYLKNKYKTIDSLNTKWGSARWSLQYRDFDDVIAPHTGTWTHPSLWVEWSSFHSENIAEYVDEQAAVIKQYFSVPVGTDMMPILGQDHYRTTKNLDIVQFNHYDKMDELYRPSFWFDYCRPIKDRPFWNTETQTVWNGSEFANSGYRPKGNCYINTWLPIAKGGEMNLYWLWKTHYAGHELGHGAVLTTAGRFYHSKDEIIKASEDFEKCAEVLQSAPVKSDVALHFSGASGRMFKRAPLIKDLDYIRTIGAVYHKPLRHYNVDVIDTAHSVEGYKVIVSPFVADLTEHGLKDRMIEWVKAGGTWIVGPMSDIMTDYAAKHTAAPYSFLEELCGVHTEFQMPVPNDVFKAKWKDGSELNISMTFDGYKLAGAESLADYTNDYPEGLSVVTKKKVGKGEVILCGSVVAGADLMKLLPVKPILPATGNIELVKRSDGTVVVLELENKAGEVTLDGQYKNLLDGKSYSGKLTVNPHEVYVLKK